jgi:hypothetical protein
MHLTYSSLGRYASYMGIIDYGVEGKFYRTFPITLFSLGLKIVQSNKDRGKKVVITFLSGSLICSEKETLLPYIKVHLWMVLFYFPLLFDVFREIIGCLFIL